MAANFRTHELDDGHVDVVRDGLHHRCLRLQLRRLLVYVLHRQVEAEAAHDTAHPRALLAEDHMRNIIYNKETQ